VINRNGNVDKINFVFKLRKYGEEDKKLHETGFYATSPHFYLLEKDLPLKWKTSYSKKLASLSPSKKKSSQILENSITPSKLKITPNYLASPKVFSVYFISKIY